MYSPLGLVIFVAVEGTCLFYKRSRSLYFKLYSFAAAYEMTNVISLACKQKRTRNWPRRTVPCDLRRASLPVPPLFSIMLFATLCSKKWYDMPHIRCGIHSLQWSTIPRIGRHSAVYNKSACALFFINYNNR